MLGHPDHSDHRATGDAFLELPDGGPFTASTDGIYQLRAKCITIPAGGTMLTGGIGYTYSLGKSDAGPGIEFIDNNLPLTQTNVPALRGIPALQIRPNATYGGTGGLIVPALDVSMAATGYTARRSIRGDLQVRRLPRYARRRARLPRRPAQRRGDLQLLPQPEPDEQRMVREPDRCLPSRIGRLLVPGEVSPLRHRRRGCVDEVSGSGTIRCSSGSGLAECWQVAASLRWRRGSRPTPSVTWQPAALGGRQRSSPGRGRPVAASTSRAGTISPPGAP